MAWFGAGTYSVADGVLLLSSQHTATSLGRVQSSVSSHNSFAGTPTTVSFASNLGDGIPVSHFDVWFDVLRCRVMTEVGI